MKKNSEWQYWIGKLTSRKFVVSLVAFVGAMLTAFNFNELVIEQVGVIMMGIGALIAYIFGEAWVDASREKADVLIFDDEECEDDN